MLISLKEMLAKAREEQFAVGAFNTTDLNLVRAVIEEAEATQSPRFCNLRRESLTSPRRNSLPM